MKRLIWRRQSQRWPFMPLTHKESTFMKLSPVRLATLVAFTLPMCACGGGGDSGATTPTEISSPSFTEFAGVWKRDAASDACMVSFPYNTAYHYRLRDIVISEQPAGNLRAVTAYNVYADAACTVKQGLVTETFALNPSQFVVSGRTNLISSEPVMSGSTLGADGGAGLTVTTMPDGQLSGFKNVKLIADVDADRLLITTSNMGTPLFSSGYPAAIDPNHYYVR
jgi:hypothetical protein